MTVLNILYLGMQTGTSLDRAHAYRRLGHHITHIDPRHLLPSSVWMDRISWRFGAQYLAPYLGIQLSRALKGQHFDLCHVDCGEWITPSLLALLKAHAGRVINYCIDDPTGARDANRFIPYRQAVSEYDLLVVMRVENVAEAQSLGARKVLRVFMSADEVSHAPRPLSADDQRKWQCQVLFLGTWMPERGPFLLELVRRGVPLTLQGSHWHKAPEWGHLKAHWRGDAISGDDYAKAIQCASINLGLLSKGNRDGHTTRSMEVPALGGLLCAERTPEHMGLYQEGVDAVFWTDAHECAEQCLHLLSQPEVIHRLAQSGHRRFWRQPHRNEAVLQRILQTVNLAPAS